MPRCQCNFLRRNYAIWSNYTIMLNHIRQNLTYYGSREFFQEYSESCKLTEDGLPIRYPQQGQPLSKMPFIKKQRVYLEHFQYIGFQNVRKNDDRNYADKTVGFFLRDIGFEHLCFRPLDYTSRLGQYRQVLSPDLSCYSDMQIADQWTNVFLNRLIGAYWQSCGLTVIPTLSWSDEKSFPFCFEGVAKESVVAVSTNGTAQVRPLFMEGFILLCKQISPETVICYCKPYPEMYNYAKILYTPHEGNQARKMLRYRQVPGQMSFCFDTGKIDTGGL